MRISNTFILFIMFVFFANAATPVHWLILVNGKRVFECPATCSANGLNLKMLKADAKLSGTDKITIIISKDTVESHITKNILVSDSYAEKFQVFSIYDEEGTHAITIEASNFMKINDLVLWYSERKVVDSNVVDSPRFPLVYFE